MEGQEEEEEGRGGGGGGEKVAEGLNNASTEAHNKINREEEASRGGRKEPARGWKEKFLSKRFKSASRRAARGARTRH